MHLLIYSGQNYIFFVVNFLGLLKASLMEEKLCLSGDLSAVTVSFFAH